MCVCVCVRKFVVRRGSGEERGLSKEDKSLEDGTSGKEKKERLACAARTHQAEIKNDPRPEEDNAARREGSAPPPRPSY